MAVLESASERASCAHIWLGARDVAAVKGDRAGIRQVVTADDVDQGRLTGAVGADEAEDLPWLDSQGDVSECPHTGKGTGNPGHAKFA